MTTHFIHRGVINLAPKLHLYLISIASLPLWALSPPLGLCEWFTQTKRGVFKGTLLSSLLYAVHSHRPKHCIQSHNTLIPTE